MPGKKRKTKEYVWKEKQKCPYCSIRTTKGRLIRHISQKHTEKQFHQFMEKEKHKFDSLFKLLKKIETEKNKK